MKNSEVNFSLDAFGKSAVITPTGTSSTSGTSIAQIQTILASTPNVAEAVRQIELLGASVKSTSGSDSAVDILFAGLVVKGVVKTAHATASYGKKTVDPDGTTIYFEVEVVDVALNTDASRGAKVDTTPPTLPAFVRVRWHQLASIQSELVLGRNVIIAFQGMQEYGGKPYVVVQAAKMTA